MLNRGDDIGFRLALAFAAFTLGSCSERTEDAAAELPGAVPTTVESSENEYCDLTQRYEAVGECNRFVEQYAALDAGIDAFKPDEKMRRSQPKIVRYAVKRLPDSVQGENGEIATPDPVTSAQPSSSASADAEKAAGEAMSSGDLTQEDIDVAIEQTGDDVAGSIVADAEKGTVQTGTVKIARLMYACLEGDPVFVIAPAACQTLDTLEQPEPVWQWTVTPTEQGDDFELRLRSGIEVTASDGSARRIGQPVRRAEIDVDVDGAGRVKDMFDRAAEWLKTPLGAIAALTTLLIALAGLRAAWKKLARGDAGTPR